MQARGASPCDRSPSSAEASGSVCADAVQIGEPPFLLLLFVFFVSLLCSNHRGGLVPLCRQRRPVLLQMLPCLEFEANACGTPGPWVVYALPFSPHHLVVFSASTCVAPTAGAIHIFPFPE